MSRAERIWPWGRFSPWRPILVSPVGFRAFSETGRAVMLHETIVFLPLFLFAVWPRRERESDPTAD